MKACEHLNFGAHCDIHRWTDSEEKDVPVTGYHIDVRVHCADCGEPFHFVGVPMGMSLIGGARMSVDGLTLNCKIDPGKLEIPAFGKFPIEVGS